GLLLAYEQTGYDTTTTSRLPDCLVDWSVKRLKEAGADAVKFLLYYDVDGDEYINQQKQAYIERIGSECQAEDIPFFLELLTYDEAILDNQSVAFAKLKAHKVNEAMKVFSAERFGVDVLKVEVPVNMAYVEGFAEGEVVYSKEEAMQAFRDQEAASHLPYIYLSAGVSASLFQETLVFAAEAGARFNGVLCGRATWSGAVAVYMSEGEEAARQWLRTEGFQNIDRLNQVLERTASPWTTKLTLEEA
ncbi:TPA: tagatose-bisphosphate aldolase, partial [Streptococcus equi subsp. zooepidemicus]|nr:tagatose-bisphosphate aldolase [Streptococcus equi subsp. zooepidemicus]